jgi:hypothetical protein
MSFAFLKDRIWLKALVRDAFGREFVGFVSVAFLLGALCLAIKGWDATLQTLSGDVTLLLKLMPRLLVALSIAALIWVMLPRNRISQFVGKEAGLGGLIVATVAGTITPGGPASAYPLLALLGASGADRGAMVAYITAWATLGLQRVLVWDVPFMGVELAILRTLISLPLPIIAGLIARRLPFPVVLRTAPSEPDTAEQKA